jgi:hypothetical protein
MSEPAEKFMALSRKFSFAFEDWRLEAMAAGKLLREPLEQLV